MLEKREMHLSVYLRSDEKKVLQVAADRAGMLLGSWARAVLIKAAKQPEIYNADND